MKAATMPVKRALTSLARLATIPQFVQAQLVGLIVAIVTLALSDTLTALRVDVARGRAHGIGIRLRWNLYRRLRL